MLVAQQPAPGEDFLLFSADAIDLLGAPASSSADALTPALLPLDEHSAHYRGAVAASWMGSHHLWLREPAVPPVRTPPRAPL